MSSQNIFSVIGESPTRKVIEYLIEGRDFDYTLTDLTNAGVSWGTLHVIFPKLIKYGLVAKTRDVGRAKLYKINQENTIAKKLIELYDTLITGAIKLKESKTKICA